MLPLVLKDDGECSYKFDTTEVSDELSKLSTAVGTALGYAGFIEIGITFVVLLAYVCVTKHPIVGEPSSSLIAALQDSVTVGGHHQGRPKAVAAKRA